MENSGQKPVWKTRPVKGTFPEREFEIAFWQEQGDEAIFAPRGKWWSWPRNCSTNESPHFKELLQLNNAGVDY